MWGRDDLLQQRRVTIQLTRVRPHVRIVAEDDTSGYATRAERALQSGRVAQLADGDIDRALGLLDDPARVRPRRR